MGSFNPNNQLYGFPNSTIARAESQPIGSLVTLGGTGFGPSPSFACTAYRSGDRLVGQASLVSGVSIAALGWIQLPYGLTVNTSIAPAPATSQRYGLGVVVVASGSVASIVTAGLIMIIYCDGVNKDRLYLAARTQSGSYVQDAGNALLGNGDRLDINFDIPISQWVT